MHPVDAAQDRGLACAGKADDGATNSPLLDLKVDVFSAVKPFG